MYCVRTFYCHQCQTFHGFRFVRRRERPTMFVKGGIKTCSRCKQDVKRRRSSTPGNHNPLRRHDKIRNKLSMLH